MKFIDLHTPDPFFNLAAEEYLMKQSSEEFFMIYINDPSVVVGKHQNTYAETNFGFTLQHELKIARRISGGGTVYHDHGNLNFSFITNEEEGNFINFRKYTRPVIEALTAIGLSARLGKRNEILLGDLKITGTASHVFKQRVLHHGTLLFDANREHLSGALEVQPEKFTDRAVKSVRSAITNIREHLETDISMEEFSRHILQTVKQAYPEGTLKRFSGAEAAAIGQLAEEKYSKPDWIFGYSPAYTFSGSGDTGQGNLSVVLEVSKGVIKMAELKLDGQRMPGRERALVGAKHQLPDIEQIMTGFDPSLIVRLFF